MQEIKKAYAIAEKNLRRCYGPKGIFAGRRHFEDYWARDSFFASLGSLAAGDYEIVKKNLALFSENICRNGQIPLRFGKSSFGIVLSAIGIKEKRRPVYFIDKARHYSLDQNSLYLIAAHSYLKITRDRAFVAGILAKLEKAIEWSLHKDIDGDSLLEEEAYCSWADSIRKKGKVLYSNVCHCHALYCMSEIEKTIGNEKKARYYSKHYHDAQRRINDVFWSGEHYLDWIENEKIYNYFSTDGNILAVLWGIADRERARRIEECSHLFDVNDIPSQCVHPKYQSNLISWQLKLLGLADYHNGLSWLWLGAMNALAKNRIGMKKEAVLLLDKMASLIIEHGNVYEVYDNKGGPVKRLLYRSEVPFAWSAGLFVYAVKEILE